MRIFNSGDFFGELILDGDENCKRTASAIAITNIQMVIIDQADYNKYFKEVKKQKEAEKVHIVSHFIPTIKEISKTSSLPILYSFKSRELKNGALLFKEGDVSEELIILTKGSVRLKKRFNKHVVSSLILDQGQENLIIRELTTNPTKPENYYFKENEDNDQ